ncbi:MAG: MBL fold metallo-hydrolase [Rhodospirillales bacterium]|nr:MBL fold metallo-hydrolase [Rhodospirillales bacterium]
MKITVLGCGGSGGVPLIGCGCPICRSPDPRNKRTRVSVVVEEGPTRILVDCAPDLRQQFLAAGLATVDAVILTHGHADHLHGIDDLRSVNYHRNAPLDLWGEPDTLRLAQERFGYAFERPRTHEGAWYAPALVPRPIEGPFAIGALAVTPFRQIHGGDRDPTLGLRFGKFAYSTDVKEMPDEAFAALEGIDTWIVDCLQVRPSPAHSHLEQTLAWIARVKPRRAILTHMNHTVDYTDFAAQLPSGVEPAYDGMTIEP